MLLIIVDNMFSVQSQTHVWVIDILPCKGGVGYDVKGILEGYGRLSGQVLNKKSLKNVLRVGGKGHLSAIYSVYKRWASEKHLINQKYNKQEWDLVLKKITTYCNFIAKFTSHKYRWVVYPEKVVLSNNLSFQTIPICLVLANICIYVKTLLQQPFFSK